MKDGNGYSVNCCNEEHRAALSSRLFRLSQMTWLEIKNAGRHQLGSEKIPRHAIHVGIPEKVTADTDLLALRYHGKAPMIGFRDGRIFYIIFLDHTMDVYDHG